MPRMFLSNDEPATVARTWAGIIALYHCALPQKAVESLSAALRQPDAVWRKIWVNWPQLNTLVFPKIKSFADVIIPQV